MVARIEIELIQPSKRGKFDDVIIHLYNGNEHFCTNINFDFIPLYSFARDKESVAFDFLFFSVLIYNIDRFVNRNIFSLEGWTREIEVTNIPILHLAEFQRIRTEMNDAISFLTGDLWNINYCQSEGILFQEKKNIINRGEIGIFDKVCLFSGGLDSLIGAIDELEHVQPGKKLLLISHKDLGKEGKDQESIIDILNRQHFYENKYVQIQTSVGIGKKNMGERIARESTFRSRSLLFIAMGIYAAHKIGQNIPLIIPENGTIALNVPLMPSRRSACSTRTTHPEFLDRIKKILAAIGISNPMDNPCELKTKGEMVYRSVNQLILRQLIDFSCSCAKRGHTSHWDASPEVIAQNNIRHCGMCLPCIYRRVSLHMNGLDINASMHYGTDVFNGIIFDINNKGQKSPRDFRALLEFIRTRPSIERIEKELLINGMHDVSRIRGYAVVVDRTINQIIDWISAFGNADIKRKAGI
jgi:hypothetical protein